MLYCIKQLHATIYSSTSISEQSVIFSCFKTCADLSITLKSASVNSLLDYINVSEYKDVSEDWFTQLNTLCTSDDSQLCKDLIEDSLLCMKKRFGYYVKL